MSGPREKRGERALRTLRRTEVLQTMASLWSLIMAGLCVMMTEKPKNQQGDAGPGDGLIADNPKSLMGRPAGT